MKEWAVNGKKASYTERWLGLPTGLLIPRLPRPALQMAVAIVGAGIMPANFYLHSALVHSR